MVNHIIMVGNLTKDVEISYVSNGVTRSSTTIITPKKYTFQNGEQKDEPCLMDISFFGKVAEFAYKYLKKGSKVSVEGYLTLDQWIDQNGHKCSKHSMIVEEVVPMVERKSFQSAHKESDIVYMGH